MLEEKALAFDAHLIEFGLDPLNDDLPDACSIWVKEFYVILPIVHWQDPYLVIRVWGVDIPLNCTTINNVLGFPGVPNTEFEAKL